MQIVLQFLTLISVLATLYLTWRKYRRDHEFQAVVTSTSIRSFERNIKFCETVTIQISNLSRFPATLTVDVFAEGICIHYVNQGQHPQKCHSALHLPTWVIAPNKDYKHDICIHVREKKPSNAIMSLYLNDRLFRKFVYAYDSPNGYYRVATEAERNRLLPAQRTRMLEKLFR